MSWRLLGQRDAFLKLIESAFDCEILVRGNEITISGPPAEAERVGSIFEELLNAARARQRALRLRRGRGDPDDQGRE
jgi:phosphate starvation-inducible PhoH-like protein